MDLAQSVQDFIQAGRPLFATFEWLLSLTGSRAPEFGVDCRVVRTIVISMFVLSALWLLIRLQRIYNL